MLFPSVRLLCGLSPIAVFNVVVVVLACFVFLFVIYAVCVYVCLLLVCSLFSVC